VLGSTRLFAQVASVELYRVSSLTGYLRGNRAIDIMLALYIGAAGRFLKSLTEETAIKRSCSLL
jgi:hypothetical protein